MKRSVNPILCFLTILFFQSTSFGQYYKEYYDGPYIFDQGDSLLIKWIAAGDGFTRTVAKNQADLFKERNLPEIDLQDLDVAIDTQAYYIGAKKVVALSDVHGQYDIMIKLLRAHGVIDDQNLWAHDKNHLVIVGDNLDRGDRMVDILWFLFKLEKQAQRVGGKVHVLLGNHEQMVLNGDLRYLNRKYAFTSGFFQETYDQFYRRGSVLGDWIASHKVAVSIDNRLFVHGGISPAAANANYSLEEMNRIYQEYLIRPETPVTDPQAIFLGGDDGPLWYRGYFDPNMSSATIDSVLEAYGQIQIVVGHTSQEKIISLHDETIVALDCSIKLGESGQLAIIKRNTVEVGNIDGTKEMLIDFSAEFPSLYSQLYDTEGHPKIRIETDYGRLLGKRRKEEYQPAVFHLDGTDLTLNARIRARGNIRKEVCRIPPVKIDFSKSDLDSAGYFKNDKLKMVWPCRERDLDQEKLYKEYFLYGLFNILEPEALRAKLVEVEIIEKGKVEHDFTAILVEDEEEYARRQEAIVIEKGKLHSSILDRECFLKMVLFQYMISNTDWAVPTKHNLEMVKLSKGNKIKALPYDFDYSGFVGQRYAVPHESLPIRSVHERYFFPYDVTEEEVDAAIELFKAKKDEIIAYCNNATYMEEKTRKKNLDYLMEFLKDLDEPKKIKKKMPIQKS